MLSYNCSAGAAFSRTVVVRGVGFEPTQAYAIGS